MKRIAVLLLIIASSFGFSQEMIPPLPTAELKAVEFLNGNFKGDLSFSFGPETTKGTGSIKSEMVIGGRFNRAMHTYNMGEGMPTMEGMQMLTFDPGKKKYVSQWYDSTGPGAMEMTGDLKDGTLTLVGSMEAEGQKMTMRATYKKTSDGFSFLLEMQQGTTWQKLMEGAYKKA